MSENETDSATEVRTPEPYSPPEVRTPEPYSPPEVLPAEAGPATGAFVDSLKRNNKQIRADRAEAISEDAELRFRRTIEDLRLEMRKVRRERENMLDMSPDNAMSLKLAIDFNAQDFVDMEIKLGLKLRNLGIKLDVTEKRFLHLFGKGV